MQGRTSCNGGCSRLSPGRITGVRSAEQGGLSFQAESVQRCVANKWENMCGSGRSSGLQQGSAYRATHNPWCGVHCTGLCASGYT